MYRNIRYKLKVSPGTRVTKSNLTSFLVFMCIIGNWKFIWKKAKPSPYLILKDALWFNELDNTLYVLRVVVIRNFVTFSQISKSVCWHQKKKHSFFLHPINTTGFNLLVVMTGKLGNFIINTNTGEHLR